MACLALAKPGSVLIKHENGFVSMEPWVTFLSVCQIDRFERCDCMLFVAQLMTGLECRPHMIIDLVNFRPGLRNDHNRVSRASEVDITLREFVLLVERRTHDDCRLLVQTIK